ncbi:unnamed protein product [Withania somnifera]
MAANFWISSQYKELLDPEEVDVVHQLDKERDVAKLAQNVEVRQSMILVWFAPTRLYLASKAEESTVQAGLLVFYIKKLYSDDKYKYEIKDLLDMEMKVLETLNYYLVVYHPYRSLSQFLQDAGLNDATQLTWGITNDTYKTDLILIHLPNLITLACMYIASVLKDKDTTAWFEELRVDMNVVKNIAIEMLDYYDNHKSIPDERTHAAMSKLAGR